MTVSCKTERESLFLPFVFLEGYVIHMEPRKQDEYVRVKHVCMLKL